MRPFDPTAPTPPLPIIGNPGCARLPAGRLSPLLVLTLCFVLAPFARAQSIPQTTSETTTSETTTSESATPITDGPSRFVSESDLDAYVLAMSSTFSMRTRDTDPFGQLQDPDATPIAKPKIAKTTRRATPTRITPFTEIIRMIQVTTIMPGEQRFLIGTRSFKQGDRFPMNFRGRTMHVEIASVNSREIEFRNLDDSETASLTLNLLPAGMTPGNGKITAPGMVREHANSPLEIEPAYPSTDNAQN